MKQISTIILLLCALVSTAVVQAQPQKKQHMKGMGKEKIKEAKKEFLTEQLVLSEAQAQKFWPLYDTFESEIDANRDKMRALKKGFAVKSDADLEKDLNQFFTLKEQETAIERKYFTKFQGVINIRQIAVLYQSEHQFKRWLFEKLRDQMGGQPMLPDDE